MGEVCRWCGKDIEDKADPCITGRQEPKWVHVPGGHGICYPQHGQSSPWAVPGE